MPIYKVPATLYLYPKAGPGWKADEIDFDIEGGEQLGTEGTVAMSFRVNPRGSAPPNGSEALHGVGISISVSQASLDAKKISATLQEASGSSKKIPVKTAGSTTSWDAGATVLSRRQTVSLRVPFVRKAPGKLLATATVKAQELKQAVELSIGFTLGPAS